MQHLTTPWDTGHMSWWQILLCVVGGVVLLAVLLVVAFFVIDFQALSNWGKSG